VSDIFYSGWFSWFRYCHTIDLSRPFLNFDFIIMARVSGEISPAIPEQSNADTGPFPNTDKSSHTAMDPDMVDFDGPDDPDNAMNWPRGKKAAAIGMVTAMTLFSYVPFHSPLAVG
jgi:hypothetical protein